MVNWEWISASAVEDYLNDNNIGFDFDEFGFNTVFGHIDVYDKMINLGDGWIIDWEDSPECKLYEFEIVKESFEEVEN